MAVADKTWVIFKTHFKAAGIDLRRGNTTTNGYHGATNYVDADASVANSTTTTQSTIIANTQAVIAASELALAAALACQASLAMPSTASTSVATNISTITTPIAHENPPRRYCWTHDLTLNMAHNSATCEKQYPDHRTDATEHNTLGGCATVYKHQGDPT
jgi:hypothetical protein